MQEIAVVKRRSRLWPILLAVLVVAVVLLLAFWFLGTPGALEFDNVNRAPAPPAAAGMLSAHT